eukprot:CAMPEP_0171133770 /NCGR_PEP_ID=MMETSP0766_2-20121228/126836_1 /TAXON_ID=439317 /ORGANISM="Gambierdiscus australes, Strain CAWD 149" /LENGTH=65 /DNA_ID=CAMNT_0011597171 /DNA_START=272 /DNA_END=469 /DNA_ORIENTATION=-
MAMPQKSNSELRCGNANETCPSGLKAAAAPGTWGSLHSDHASTLAEALQLEGGAAWDCEPAGGSH